MSWRWAHLWIACTSLYFQHHRVPYLVVIQCQGQVPCTGAIPHCHGLHVRTELISPFCQPTIQEGDDGCAHSKCRSSMSTKH